jgi:hypothetical protein
MTRKFSQHFSRIQRPVGEATSLGTTWPKRRRRPLVGAGVG